jgi:hypothetical protein
MGVSDLLWAYIGPDVMLPLASIVASIVGILLIGWRIVLKCITKGFRFLFGKKTEAEVPGAHATAAVAVVNVVGDVPGRPDEPGPNAAPATGE